MKAVAKPLILSLFMASCASAPQNLWFPEVKTDQFTDKTSCSVTIGSSYISNTIYTYSGHFYPFIEIVNEDLRIGIRSGGKVRIPVGDVQIRIDSNPPWTITTGETPIDYIPKGNLESLKNSVPEASRSLVQNSFDTAMESTAKAMSPFTAATGKKAKAILKQMIHGQKIIYRSIGLNQAASSTGEVPIDQSFLTALSSCGINTSNL